MSGLRTAASFLTRVPLHRDLEAASLSRSIPWFPVVGAVVGSIVAAVYVGCTTLMAPGVAAVLAVGCGAMITGAFHQDGLADVADAFGGGWNREQRLEILKDSRLGTYGVTALIVVLALEFAVVSSLGRAGAVAALVSAHALSRSFAVAAMRWAPQAHGEGLGAAYTNSLTGIGALTGTGFGVATTVGLMGWWVLLAVPLALLGCVATVGLAVRKIGGVTGDVLGAVQQVTGALILVSAAIASESNTDWVWWADLSVG